MHTPVRVSSGPADRADCPVLRHLVDLPADILWDRHVLRRPRCGPDRRGGLGRRGALRSDSRGRRRPGRGLAHRPRRRRPSTRDRCVEPQRSRHRPTRVRPVRRSRRRVDHRSGHLDRRTGRRGRPHGPDGADRESAADPRAGVPQRRRRRRHDQDGARSIAGRLRRRWFEGARDPPWRGHTARCAIGIAAPPRNSAATVDLGASRARQGHRVGHRRHGRTRRCRPASRVRRGRGDAPEGP